MGNHKSRSLTFKVYWPIATLSLLCFIGLSSTSLLIIESLVSDSIQRQAKSSIEIFSNSIRDDLLHGLDKEVYRKCQSTMKNDLITGLQVSGLDNRSICNETKENIKNSFSLVKDILFTPNGKDIAGKVIAKFKNDLVQKIINRVAVILLITMLLLLFGYWIVSIYFIRKETKKFTKLSSLLTESDITKLENCSSEFKGNQVKEIDELCLGIEKLSKNWRDYQSELLRNERLLAVNESSRLLAHDIKSPLSAIRIVSQMLFDKPLESKKLLEKAIVKIEKMLGDIVENDDKKIKPKFEKTDIITFIQAISYELNNTSNTCSINFSNKTENSSFPVNIDRQLIERSLQNIVKNAIEAIGKQTGKITVELLVTDNNYTISISDNGPGIPSNIVRNLGTQGYSYGKDGGSGLGLYQVMKTMDAHNGKMEIESELGVGTKFLLKFPI